MRITALARLLTPRGWAAIVVVALGLGLLLLARGIGLRWDPFGLTERRIERAEGDAALASRDAAARRLEVEGERAMSDRLAVSAGLARALDQATLIASGDARQEPDADDPLPSRRAYRLHEHDRELCRLAPDLDGCPAAS